MEGLKILRIFTPGFYLLAVKDFFSSVVVSFRAILWQLTKVSARIFAGLLTLAVILSVVLHYTSRAWIPFEEEVLIKIEASTDFVLKKIGLTSIAKAEGIIITPSEELDRSDGMTYAEAHALEEGVLPTLVLCVIEQESNWNHLAESSAGAIGMMQVMPANAPYCGTDKRSLYKERINVRCGVKILKTNLETWNGDPVMALRAYNASQKCYKGGCPTVEAYVKSVLSCVARRQNEGRFLMAKL